MVKSSVKSVDLTFLYIQSYTKNTYNPEKWGDMIMLKRLYRFDLGWVNPYIGVFWYFCITLIYIVTPDFIFEKFYFVHKYLNLQYIIYTFCVGVILALGIWLGKKAPVVRILFSKFCIHPTSIFLFLVVIDVIFSLFSILGILGEELFLLLIRDPMTPTYTIKWSFKEPTGSLLIQQATLLGFPLYIIVMKNEKSPLRRIITSLLFVVLVILTIFRAIIWSNRLLIFEALIPFLIVNTYLSGRKYPKSFTISRLKIFVFIAIGAIFAAFLIFSFGEYFRTWRNIPLHERTVGHFFIHSFTRFVGNYLTAQNNAAAIMLISDLEHTPFFFSLNWFWTNSFLGSIIRYEAISDTIVPLTIEESFTFPIRFGLNPSFNVFGMNGYTFLDFGWYGLIIIFMIGFFIGYLWKLFNKGVLYGLLIYPYLIIGLLESPRILYFGESRFFYTALVGLFLTFILPFSVNSPKIQGR